MPRVCRPQAEGARLADHRAARQEAGTKLGRATGQIDHRDRRARGQHCEHPADVGGPGGELDLVLRQGSTLIACEVKTRSGTGFGDPLDAITPAKQARLRRLLATWATEHGGGADVLRVDSVGIVWPEHERPLLRHVVGDLS